MKQCNMSEEYAVIHELPLPGHHWLTFRRLTLIFSSCFGLTAIFISIALIMLHATHYSKPWEQKHIMRILTMVPVYAILAWFSFMFYHKAVYISIAQLVYESVVIASFYMLMCHWMAPDLSSQQDLFRRRKPQRWAVIRFCGVRAPQNGLTWFNIISAAVLQYVLVRPLLALAALITQATKQYCNESLSPAFAHLWILVISVVSVSVAMWGLANFYFEVRKDLASRHPGSKFVALKLVVFFTFFQNIVINLIAASGHVHSTPTFAIDDLRVGLPAMLICLEMALFATLHIFTYSWKPYRVDRTQGYAYRGGFFGIMALVDACNVWDIVKELARSWKWVFTTAREDHGDKASAHAHNLGEWGSETGEKTATPTVKPLA